MDERYRENTTLSIYYSLFQFIRMVFGLINVPATFRPVTDSMLFSLKWQTALVYLADIFVSSKTVE